jgi:hypothetical protein
MEKRSVKLFIVLLRFVAVWMEKPKESVGALHDSASFYSSESTTEGTKAHSKI